MVLKLDPRFPAVWRNPSSLQIGVDPVRLRLNNMPIAEERMVAALSVGVIREGLELIADTSGVARSEVDRLLAKLAPVLYLPPVARRGSVVVAGTGPTADRIIGNLAESGVRVFIAASAEDATAADAEFAIVVGHFVVPPSLFGLWLNRDIPHLPVLFGDSAVRIGPIVEPGATACLYCFERHRIDADPAWPALATQLLTKRSRIESALVASETAAAVTRLALGRIDGNRQSPAAMVLEAETGRVSLVAAPVHPLCGCSTLEESDWANDSSNATAARPRPRKVRVSAARG